jgi:hypothetical protein
MGLIRGSGLVSGVFLLSFLIVNSAHGDSKTDFINSCTKTTLVSSSRFVCHVPSDDGDGELTLSMIQGQAINVSGTGHYAKIHGTIYVSSKPLNPRLSDVGALEASVLFAGRVGNTVVTIDIPCGQNFYAAVGFGQNQPKNVLPPEWSAQCDIQ